MEINVKTKNKTLNSQEARIIEQQTQTAGLIFKQSFRNQKNNTFFSYTSQVSLNIYKLKETVQVMLCLFFFFPVK